MIRSAVMCVGLAGCVTQIQRVDPAWDHRSEPQCTTSYAPVAGDALVAGIATSTGLVALGSVRDRSASLGIGIPALAIGLGFGIAATLGEHEVRDCRAAKAQWSVDTALQPPPPRGAGATSHRRSGASSRRRGQLLAGILHRGGER